MFALEAGFNVAANIACVRLSRRRRMYDSRLRNRVSVIDVVK